MNVEINIKKISKILGITPPKIVTSDVLPNSYSNGVIFIERGMSKSRTFYVLLHELRHHYQFEYVKNNNDKLAMIYKKELESYNSSQDKHLDYFIERDAYTFAYVVLNEYFKINYELPKFLLDVINNHLDKYKYLYLNFYNNKV